MRKLHLTGFVQVPLEATNFGGRGIMSCGGYGLVGHAPMLQRESQLILSAGAGDCTRLLLRGVTLLQLLARS